MDEDRDGGGGAGGAGRDVSFEVERADVWGGWGGGGGGDRRCVCGGAAGGEGRVCGVRGGLVGGGCRLPGVDTRFVECHASRVRGSSAIWLVSSHLTASCCALCSSVEPFVDFPEILHPDHTTLVRP